MTEITAAEIAVDWAACEAEKIVWCDCWKENVVSLRDFSKRRQIARRYIAAVERLQTRVKQLEFACSKQNDEVCQSLGKALGYPWFKDDRKNFPDSDDSHGVCVGEHVAESIADEAAATISRLQAELARVTAERDAARRALEALNKCPLSCQWVLCTECEAALIAALPEKP